MAAKNSSKPKLAAVTNPSKAASLDERAHVALRATWQLASIFGEITKIARKNEPEEFPVHALLLALAIRGTDLNNLISSALGDDLHDVDDLWERLNEYEAEAANG